MNNDFNIGVADCILLVEDDIKLSCLIKDYLEQGHGFRVSVEQRGDMATERILNEQPELVILDIMLPGKDGLTICREVRERYLGPILMLTALGDEVDEVVGLEIGADDYMSKPVNPRLLVARIRTLLRRFERKEGTRESTGKRLCIGPLAVDASTRSAQVNTEEVPLTNAEFDMLFYLAEHAGNIVTREQLYRDLRGIEWDGIDRSIDLRVARLRKKLGDDGKQPDLIKSVRGSGYILAITP